SDRHLVDRGAGAPRAARAGLPRRLKVSPKRRSSDKEERRERVYRDDRSSGQGGSMPRHASLFIAHSPQPVVDNSGSLPQVPDCAKQGRSMAAADTSTELIQVVALLGAGVIAAPVFMRLGLGSVLGYLAAGLVIGPFGLQLFTHPQ